MKRKLGVPLTVEGLHAELQAHVLLRVHHPVVTGGCDVKHQPAPVGRPHLLGVQQKRFCVSEWIMIGKG